MDLNRKKIVICTSGSRGEVQPYIALALELIRLGHEVTVCCEERMRGLIENDYNLPFLKAAGDPTGLLTDKASQVMLRDGQIMKLMSKMQEVTKETWPQTVADYEEACKDADIIISGQLVTVETYCIAEKYKKAWIPMLLGAPKSADYALPFIKHGSIGIKLLNKITWNLTYFALWANDKKRVNEWRTKHLHLPPITSSMGIFNILAENPKFPVLIAINRSAIPTEKRPDDWPNHWKLTGYMFAPEVDELDPRVDEFINSDPERPPLYIGFGSMPAPEPLVLIKLAIGLINAVGCRAILCAGWSEINDQVNPSPNNLISDPNAPITDEKITLPETLLLVKSVPHSNVFPRCSGIIHHCGIGTCAAALRSGVPSLGCPVMLDQPGNAAQLFKLGVSPAPLPFHQIQLPILIEATNCLLKKKSLRERAKYWAEEIAKENGIATAAEIVLTLPNQW